jgi:hypothetical protein
VVFVRQGTVADVMGWPAPRHLLSWERPDVEGATVGPKERERRLAKQRVDRSHRGVVVVRHRRPPPWTRGEMDVLVLSLAFIFAGVVLAILLFVLPT